ncbi:MAG: HIT family protein, partial [Anaerolineae bacterium]
TGDKPTGCIFCDKPKERQDTDNLILLRGEHCFIMLNRYPYNNGHLMVVPYEHVDMPGKLSAPALFELIQETNMCIEVLQESMNPEGFNVGMNLGAPAGAGIKDHVHMHIVPRWTGDTNFMPVLGDTRVIVEALERSYETLRPLFECRCDAETLRRTLEGHSNE